jgi:hypothetical protein
MVAALPAVITILALGDGVLHFALDFVLFRGNIFGSPFPAGGPPGGGPGGPPPGAPPPGPQPPQLPLQLNQLFFLNFVGFVVLVALFWLSPRFLGRRRWLVDVALILYTLTSVVGWIAFGEPNPMGLGYLSKAVEALLVVALVAHIWTLTQSSGVAPRP